MGHVQAIEPGRVTLDGGTLDIDGSALYIDCTADGFGRREPTPVFSGDHISLQAVRTCQPAFSAAVIAHVEAAYPTTTPGMRSAVRCPIRTSRPTGCE